MAAMAAVVPLEKVLSAKQMKAAERLALTAQPSSFA